MFPASTKGGGQCVLPGPTDVCKTPAPPAPVPPPMPYPNIVDVSKASKGTCSDKVKFSNQPAVTTKTEVPMSNGDEPGVAGGLVSGVNMKTMKFTTGSSTVKIEGEQACHLTVMTAHNGSNSNCPGGAQVGPSQTKVKIK